MDTTAFMRPGEPPQSEAASNCSNTLFFGCDRYDLFRVGRVKMKQCPSGARHRKHAQRTLDRDDIVACIKALVDLRDGSWRHRRILTTWAPSCGRSVRRADGKPVRVWPAPDERADQGTYVFRRNRHCDATGSDQRETSSCCGT